MKENSEGRMPKASFTNGGRIAIRQSMETIFEVYLIYIRLFNALCHILHSWNRLINENSGFSGIYEGGGGWF